MEHIGNTSDGKHLVKFDQNEWEALSDLVHAFDENSPGRLMYPNFAHDGEHRIAGWVVALHTWSRVGENLKSLKDLVDVFSTDVSSAPSK